VHDVNLEGLVFGLALYCLWFASYLVLVSTYFLLLIYPELTIRKPFGLIYVVNRCWGSITPYVLCLNHVPCFCVFDIVYLIVYVFYQFVTI
jgi:hypothetical protein